MLTADSLFDVVIDVLTLINLWDVVIDVLTPISLLDFVFWRVVPNQPFAYCY